MIKRRRSIAVNHYWSKLPDVKYCGRGQQLFIEIFITALSISLTVLTFRRTGLELFFVGFLIPSILFSVGTVSSLVFWFIDRRSKHDKRQLLKKIIEAKK